MMHFHDFWLNHQFFYSGGCLEFRQWFQVISMVCGLYDDVQCVREVMTPTRLQWHDALRSRRLNQVGHDRLVRVPQRVEVRTLERWSRPETHVFYCFP